MQRISEHISYIESVHSDTATRRGITNMPNEYQLENMRLVSEMIFEKCRKHFNEPIYINSFFRDTTLNHAIGGSSTSEHCSGSAMDIRFGYNSERKNKELFDYIKDNLEWNQLIWEFGEDNPRWVHVSYIREGNRKQILRAKRIDGKVRYNKYI